MESRVHSGQTVTGVFDVMTLVDVVPSRGVVVSRRVSMSPPACPNAPPGPTDLRDQSGPCRILATLTPGSGSATARSLTPQEEWS